MKLLANSAFSHLCLGNAEDALRAVRRFSSILREFPGILRQVVSQERMPHPRYAYLAEERGGEGRRGEGRGARGKGAGEGFRRP